MPEIDHVLYEDTKDNLMAAAEGQEEIEWLVEEQLQDMKECGFFDIPEEFRTRDETERDDYY